MRAVRSSVLPLPCSRPSRFFGKQWLEVLEQDLVARVLRGVEVDLADLEQGEVALALLGWPDQAGDGIARTQIEAADLAGRHVDVVGSGQVGTVSRAQETEAVLQNLEYAVSEDVLAALRMGLQDRKDDVLLPGPGHVLKAHGLGHAHQFAGRPRLQFIQVEEIGAALELTLWDYLVLGERNDLLVVPVSARRPPPHVVIAVAMATTGVAVAVAATAGITATNVAADIAAATALGAITG